MPLLPVAQLRSRDEELAALGRRWPASGSCERRRRRAPLLRSRSASSVSRWPGWSGSSRATAGTPRCLRRGMTPLPEAASQAAPRRGTRGSEETQAGQAAPRAGISDVLGGAGRHLHYYPQGTCECARTCLDGRSRGGPVVPAAGDPRAVRAADPARPARNGVRCGRHHVAARPPGVADSPVSTGPNLRALAVYLLVFQHVPVERCRELISDAAGAGLRRVHPLLPSQGRGPGRGRAQADRDADHRRPSRRVRRDHAAGRAAGKKKYVLARSRSSTRCCTWATAPWNPSGTSGSCRTSPAWSSPTGTSTTGTPAGEHRWAPGVPGPHTQDYEDAAETYPDAHWPAQAQRGLRGLIHAWNDARDNGLPAIPEQSGAHDPGVPPRRHCRPGRRPPHPRPEELHRPAPRPRPAPILPRPRRRRAPVHH